MSNLTHSHASPATDRTPSAQTGAEPSFASARPIVLLSPPEPVRATPAAPTGPPASFYWNRAVHRVARCTNLERIETAWWQEEGAVRRDYWQVETTSGARFWLFRDRVGEWFLHGLFD
jgi:protein ImuB